ncbi:RidA family protein [Sulfitobacter aestuarii]|uniref:RidA family protein n=1 Tax=Sulfitobacter aestuarii TaxID=2161676 RepID=A0ABW5U9C2_9RHOB
MHRTIYAYEPAKRSGNILFLAGQIAKISDTEIHAAGRCGDTIDLTTAKESAEIAARQGLGWLEAQLGEGEKVRQILRMDVFVAVSPEFEFISEVADAASQVFIDAFGGPGRHPRSVIGVMRLPRNAPVLLEITAEVGR